MRICVFGAGAVGGHLAAKLAAAGHQVSVVARGVHLEAMRARGLVLEGGEQTIVGRVTASERTAELGPQDAVFVTTKATALGEFAAAAAPLLGPDTSVVFAQNGIPWWYAQRLPAGRPRPPDLSRLDPGGALARAVAPERIVGSVIYSANEVSAPGVIRNHTAGNNMLVIGELDNSDSARIAALRQALDAAGMASPPTRDIRNVVWNKLSRNLVSSTLCVLAEDALGPVAGSPLFTETRARVTSEGRAIAAAHGIDVDDVPARPGNPAGGSLTGHKPSMLQDYERGRPMEIEAQILAPLAFARAAGLATPTLDALAALCAYRAASKGLFK